MKQQRKFQKKSEHKQTRTRIEKKQTKVAITKDKLFVWLSIISIVTVIAYYPAFNGEITNWDDDNYIVKNPWLQELSGENLKSIFTEYYMGNYHPLAMLSLSLDFQIGGLDAEGEITPFIYHFTNILLHLINTLLVFWLALLLIKRFDVAVLTGLLFGVSTMHVESVAWISERKDVLYALFFIASLVAYVFYLKKKQTKYYIYSLVLFILSLFSKGQAVSLAVTLFIIDYLFERKLLNTKVLLEKLPFLVLAGFFGFIAIKAQQAGNAMHDSDSYEFYKRIGFAGYAFTQYLIKLTVPTGLSAIYPYPDIINKSIPAFYWLFMIPSLLVAYSFFYFLKRNKTVAFCIGFFIINIALLLQLIPVGSAILADRYSYIPSIGFYLLMAWLVIRLIDRKPKNKQLVYGMAGVYIVAISVASIMRCMVWVDSMTLWNDTIEKSPKAVVAWNNRGSMKDRAKDHRAAIEDFTRAIVLKPDYTHAFYNRGTAKKDLAIEMKDSLAILAVQKGNMVERKDSLMLLSALKDFDQAIEFEPDFVEAFHNRGITYETLADYARTIQQKLDLLTTALKDQDKTIELDFSYENALMNRAVIKGKIGQMYGQLKDTVKHAAFLDAAINDLNRAVEVTPDNASAYSNRGLAKDSKGDLQGAIADYNLAIEKDPEFTTAYLNKGIVYRKLGDFNQSIANFSKVIALDEKLSAAYYFRGLDFLQLKKNSDACSDLQTAAKLGHQYAAQQYRVHCLKNVKVPANKNTQTKPNK